MRPKVDGQSIDGRTLVDDVFGWVSVAADGLVLIGLDGADNSPLNLVGVPYVPTCE